MAAWLDFSPLFIGEPRAAPHVQAIGVTKQLFQSPLHRGAARGPQARRPRTPRESFSPLFIGEPRAESARLWITCCVLRFSPLFIGEPRAALSKPLFQNGLDAAFYAEIS